MAAYRLKNTDCILNMDKVDLVRLNGNEISIYFENESIDTLAFDSEKLARECFEDLSEKITNKVDK